jgi:hypothetical protein
MKCKKCGKENPLTEIEYIYLENKKVDMCNCETILTV